MLPVIVDSIGPKFWISVGLDLSRDRLRFLETHSYTDSESHPSMGSTAENVWKTKTLFSIVVFGR